MHELDHVRGGSSETLANLAGIAADLNVSASMDANQDKINSYKPAFGDGRDAVTQLENEQLLGQNDETLGDKLAENPDGFDYKTSTIQDVKYALTYFSPGARQAYEKIDASQEQAFLKGQKKAVDEFGQSIINAPDDIKALYQAAKENPTAVAIEILKSLKDIPKEYYDKGVTIVGTSFIGDSDDDFYNAGKASTELGLEAVTAIVSAGGAVVVKKTAGKVTGIEFKFPKRKPNRSDTNGTHDTGTGKNANNKANSQNTNTIGNDNYFDSFGNNAPYTRDYSAELQADIDKQKAKNDKFDAEMKAADAKREAEWTKIQAETDALLASSNELLKEVEVDRRINDRVAEADRIMDDFNHSKANENLSIEDSISISQIPQSNQNARQIINPDSPEAWDGGSERIYNSIGANNEDVLKISQNTGLPESQIQRIKNHVFFKDHELNNGSTGRYDADPDIANAWNRLEQGDYTQIDIDLLNHEIRESLVEGIFKVPAQKAHEATVNKGFDWNPSN